ncbi:unnamed protein product [Hymenolepis diminuta]|uniref:Uncharacterized protein n=1 Tax=Hymenolepis diminuta TaxID=6216 RepID=A0A564Y9F7_HYMDI|nr:unnamed protein product [Hymenolepis diminuta]
MLETRRWTLAKGLHSTLRQSCPILLTVLKCLLEHLLSTSLSPPRVSKINYYLGLSRQKKKNSNKCE